MRSVRVRRWWDLAALVILGCAVGCAAPVVTPAPQQAPAVSVPLARDPLQAPWSLVRGAGSFAHTIRLSSALVSRVDSIERVDSTTVTLGVNWSRLAGGEPARLSGLITEYRLAAGIAEPAEIPGLSLPLAFGGTEGRGAEQAQLEVPSSGACGVQAAVMQHLRELLVSPPPSLREGTRWADSASYSLCRDSIPLRVRSVRTFRVVGAERRGTDVVVLVDRSSAITLAGTGAQFGESLTIAGEGSGTMRLELRTSDATLHAARGEVELRMTMRGRRRSQELRQHTRIEIVSP